MIKVPIRGGIRFLAIQAPPQVISMVQFASVAEVDDAGPIAAEIPHWFVATEGFGG